MSSPEPVAPSPAPASPAAAPPPAAHASAPAPTQVPAPTPAPGRDLTQHPAVQRVLTALAVHGIDPELVSLPDAVRTAAAAAAAIGVTPAEIANSLIFRAHDEQGATTPLLVLTSGAHQVDLVKVAELLEGVDHVDRADADFVRRATGFAIGGVAPVGHPDPDPHRRRRVPQPLPPRLGRCGSQPHRLPHHLRRAAESLRAGDHRDGGLLSYDAADHLLSPGSGQRAQVDR